MQIFIFMSNFIRRIIKGGGLFVFLLVSCQGLKEDPVLPKDSVDLQVMVPLSRLSLFVDYSAYCFGSESVKTKSTQGEVPLESLIDIGLAKTSQWKDGVSFIQIPFLQNEEDAIIASVTSSSNPEISRASKVKKFLVVMEKPEKDVTYVVTMITDADYYNNHPDFDFLSRPNYTGVALFSNVEGNLIMMRSYRNGQILPAKAIKATEMVEPNDTLSIGYVTLFEQSSSTKSGDEWITPSYCIAFRYMELTPSYCVANGIFFDGSNWHTSNYNIGGGISGGPGNDLSGDELPVEDMPDEERFTVELSHYSPYEYSFSGEKIEAIRMLGAGEYLSGSQVVIDYMVIYTPLEFTFSYWTGDFDELTVEMPFLITVEDDIQSTAYFDTQKPCSDETRRITNPLINMSIAASAIWDDGPNYIGGTYGEIRWERGKRKWHYGIDLLANIGTPVYAVYSGFITRVDSNIQDVPFIKGKIPAYGNQIIITSERDDNTDIELRYAHLQSGNAIAINPRTGVPFTTGDRVNRGDIIGYTGRSGNAYSVPFKHLHLGVQIRNSSGVATTVNPANYINGTINVHTIKNTQGRIDNIVCD